MNFRFPVLAGTVALTTLATLVCAAPAHAGGYGAYRGIDDLVYQPGPGTASNVTIRLDGDVYTIDDVVPINLGVAGCSHPGADLTVVECAAAGVTVIRVAGSDLDDTVVNLTSTPAEIFGEEGDDHLEGGGGDDELWGGPGQDEVQGHGGDDRLTGGTGSDVMLGGPGSYDFATYLDSPVGVDADLDSLRNDGATGENDAIGGDVEGLVGSAFADVLDGDEGPNFLFGYRGVDIINGQGGNDFLFGDGYDLDSPPGLIGSDYLLGGDGRDTVYYTDHSASQRVFADADAVAGDDGAAGEGDFIARDVENLVGTPGDDILTGTAANNSIWGGAGNDVITGLDGADRLYGDAGNDTIYGGDGDDLLDGREGNDRLYGQRDVDDLYGGIGVDLCDPGAGGRVPPVDCEL